MTTDQPSTGGAMAKSEAVAATVITTPDDFRQALSGWQQQRYHVLTPLADFRALPQQYALMPAQVRINTDEQAGEVYSDPLFCKKDLGEVALTKLGLSKIAAAAGMTIKTERTDPRTIQHYWEVRATARYIGIDGTPQELDATEELDLRDGSERSAKVMGRNQSRDALRAVRAKGLRNCEARAINAVIRAFGIKQKFTKQELEKPFVILRVIFQPNMADPAQARFIMERALAGTTSLYPSSQAPALPPPEHLDTIGDVPESREPQSVGRGSTQPAQPRLPDGAITIQQVEKRDIQKRDKTTFPKWFATGSDGVEYVTTRQQTAQQLEELAKSKKPVTLSYEENDYGDAMVTSIKVLDDDGY